MTKWNNLLLCKVPLICTKKDKSFTLFLFLHGNIHCDTAFQSYCWDDSNICFRGENKDTYPILSQSTFLICSTKIIQINSHAVASIYDLSTMSWTTTQSLITCIYNVMGQLYSLEEASVMLSISDVVPCMSDCSLTLLLISVGHNSSAKEAQWNTSMAAPPGIYSLTVLPCCICNILLYPRWELNT